MIPGHFLILIIGMTVILFVTRLSGLILADRLPESSRINLFLEVLPGVTLVAIIAPDVVQAGWIGTLAAVVVWLIVKRTGYIALAMVLGIGVVALLG